jgi:UDP-GlcNAc:undecaprenyl-phosphate/decaprenyl-phosphate GlcNAc-1-phosphate transferase
MAGLIPLPLAALCCFATALALSLWGTPLAGRAAMRFGIVDLPDGLLKRHRGPIPYLGGLAVFGAFLLTMALVFDFERRVLGLLLAGTLLVLLGLMDDFGALGVRAKFLGQGLATLVLMKSGIAIQIGALPGWANTVLTVVWLVGMTNALNLIDIMDGLASGTALVASVFLLVVAVLNGQAPIVLMTATLTGSLAGFLFFNRHPARIFLGDTGSLFVGMMLGALAMIGKYDAVNPIGYLTPLLILAVPLFDTLYVMTLRVMHGRNPFKGSSDHFPLRLARCGLGVRPVVRIVWALGAALGGLGLVNLYLTGTLSILLVSLVALLLSLGGAALTLVPEPGAGTLSAASRADAEPVPVLSHELQEVAAEEAAVRAARMQLASWRRR